jgi:hypothetical protein
MRFWTIITLPAAGISEKFIRLRDWTAQEIAAKLPLRVKYWVTFQGIAQATMEHPEIPAADVSYILRNLKTPETVR